MQLSDTQKTLIAQLKDGLIVSCQAKKTDPIYLPEIIEKMAASAIWGGANGLRIDTPMNITAVRVLTKLPIIGLWKLYHKESDVFITPTLEAVAAVIKAGADVVAVDATNRQTAEGEMAYDIIKKIKKHYPDTLILADIRNETEAERALDLGAHMVAPTLYRFDPDAKSTEDPDFNMLARIVKVAQGKGFVLMEGKIHTPEQALESLFHGAHSVVVGSTITRPHLTTLRFTRKMSHYENDIPLYY
ncbi:N-acylglucosamine-6-phosphate 2-epimerase [Amphibacillus marinus]|uniref:N-acylglucosamine-6-phosphate 2-epimerase n=1 Tax=Amphibacillus marinus TaxID=872970 RepID=A0A1H8TFQ7_9BACI|nr:putative N-acetylmannosamine-6-phosphate 2-epimerase [Amphibacillus marinus]SEO89767.1 N-acylglucosamine-6-phosphate 2-epimerase [Amphibacillus marinus]